MMILYETASVRIGLSDVVICLRPYQRVFGAGNYLRQRSWSDKRVENDNKTLLQNERRWMGEACRMPMAADCNDKTATAEIFETPKRADTPQRPRYIAALSVSPPAPPTPPANRARTPQPS